MLEGLGRRNRALFRAEMGNVAVEKYQGLWQMLRQKLWLVVHAETPELTPSNKN